MTHLKEKEEEALAKVEELHVKVKALEQENLAKEQEITSLSHKNQLLEADVEKLETTNKELKVKVEATGQQSIQSEGLQRRLQLLEEEAEQADANIRETNEKYVEAPVKPITIEIVTRYFILRMIAILGYAKLMSKLVTMSERSKPWRLLVTSGRKNTRKCPRNTRV